jgi:hypothetical protein
MPEPIAVASTHWLALISAVSVVKLVRDNAIIYSVLQIWMCSVEISLVTDRAVIGRAELTLDELKETKNVSE